MRCFLFFLAILLLPSCVAAASLLETHNADDDAGVIALAGRQPPREARESFIVGKALCDRKQYGAAVNHLVQATGSDAPWTAEALWLLSECRRVQGRPAEREVALERLVADFRGSSFCGPAATSLAEIRLSAPGKASQSLLLFAAARADNRAARGKFLLFAARRALSSGNTAQARGILLEGLGLELYDNWGAALVNEMILLAARTRLTAAEEVELAAGLVRQNRERAALHRLDRLAGDKLEPALALREATVRCWIYRRMRDWTRAGQLAVRIGTMTAAGARFTSLEQRYRTAEGQGQYEQLSVIVRQMAALDRNAAREWWAMLPGQNMPQAMRLELRLEAIRLWPGDNRFERPLTEELVAMFLQGRSAQFLEISARALASLAQPDHRAGLLYFRSLVLKETGQTSAAGEAAIQALIAEPLGYYHVLLADLPPRDDLAQAALAAGTSAREAAALFFVASPAMRARIAPVLRQKWAGAAEAAVLAETQSFSRDRLAALLPEEARDIFLELLDEQLWPEALAEITRRWPAGSPFLHGQPAPLLRDLAVLAAKASRYNVEIWCRYRTLRAAGWQYELAAIERTCGGTILPRTYPRHYLPLVNQWSLRRNLDPLLVLALIRQESAFNKSVVSWAGAVGLMQLMPSTAAGIAGSLGLANYDLTDPATSIRFGCSMVGWLRDTFGRDEAAILIGYNSGPGNINLWKNRYRARTGREPDLAHFTETIPYQETRDYVKLILSNLKVYRALYGTGF